jgi:prepilin-type N-terminal cleavage/methylation domain-containing protein
MKKKGFTLVELLVVIAIIAMLLAILMPALGKVRALAYRLMCGTNLGGLGKAMAVYANDYQESYPVLSGAAGLQWANTNTPATLWETNITTNPTFVWSSVTRATITSSLYLLVKYADVSTNQFVCKAGSYKKFDLTTDTSKQNGTTLIKDVTEGWDFGRVVAVGQGGPWDYCGYAYQMPYQPSNYNATTGPFTFTLSASSPAGVAMMADASPWCKKGAFVTAVPPTATAVGTGPYIPTAIEWGIGGTAVKDRIRLANSINHNQEGQNVLFGDAHVSFENQSNVGISQDNIYTMWISNTSGSSANLVDVQGGKAPTGTYGSGGSYDSSGNDSFLVN